MKSVLIALIVSLSLLFPTASAQALTPQQIAQEKKQQAEYVALTKARMKYAKTMEADAWRVLENTYNFPQNKVTRTDYMGTSRTKVSTKTIHSFKSSQHKVWHMFTINAKNTITLAEFKATKKVLPTCKTKKSVRCVIDKSGKRQVIYTRYTQSSVK